MPIRASIPLNDVRFLAPFDDHEFNIPCCFALNLATFWPDADQPHLDQDEIGYLADGCGVSASAQTILATDDHS